MAGLILLLLPLAAAARARESTQDIVDQIDVNIYRQYLDDLLFTHDGHNRSPWGPEHDPARDNIETTLRDSGLDPYLDGFVYGGGTWYNVVAVKEGLVRPDWQYIICAHLDSVSNPGADDDASGCAAVLEIARVLSPYSFRSTIIFIAFDYHEGGPGRYGSTHYALAHQDDDIRGVIAMDMIAHNVDLNACDILGRDESVEVKLALADAVEAYSGGLIARDLGHRDCCDHNPFEDVGKPACAVAAGDAPWANPCYHQPCDSVDTPGNIDYEYAVKIVRAVCGWLVDQAVLVPGGPDCTADVNGDDVVDINDLFQLLGAWGSCGGCPEDLDGDGVVDIDDVFEVLGQWGPCPRGARAG
ncbi:MAG: M28 family peptidase [Phycisphaerales bacterium]|nr:MAG: M28 family peptidase [Phycisphaerales bacterium]